ncbi:MAG TPA: hypothetical protein VLZ33_07935 [Dysgonamonadaceae bacterium]|nr:hypothetical protein [Dysgonamonadaceae bacterium]
MKKDDKNKSMDELWMKSMMESARKEPSENFSHRIMHQIETEQALSRAPKPKMSKQKTNPLIDLRNIFGLMYLVLLILGGYFYLEGGKEALLTDTFLWTCISISSVFSVFFLITTIDNSLRKSAKSKSSASEK